MGLARSLLLAPSSEALLLIFAVVFGPPFPHHTFPATREETAEEGIFSPAYFRKTHKWPHSEAPNQRCVKINKPTIQKCIWFLLENDKMILAMEPFLGAPRMPLIPDFFKACMQAIRKQFKYSIIFKKNNRFFLLFLCGKGLSVPPPALCGMWTGGEEAPSFSSSGEGGMASSSSFCLHGFTPPSTFHGLSRS